MKNLYLIVITSLLALLLSACGGSGGDSSSANTKKSVLLCNSTNPSYTEILAGDLLVKESDSSVVTIVHNTDGSKKVCALSGVVYLLRKN